MTSRWDETWHRLVEWTNGQGPSERLAAQVLLCDAFESLDPSHPLGGPDGGKDAVCTKGGERWLMAVYFPRGKLSFATVKKKFTHDLRHVEREHCVGIAFVTNQELSLSQRESLKKLAGSIRVELYHLERVTTILDMPHMAGVRRQFLGIEVRGTDSPATKLSELLKSVQAQTTSLAGNIAEAMQIAQELKDPALTDFCHHELNGYEGTISSPTDDPPSHVTHRIITIYAAIGVEISLEYFGWNGDFRNAIKAMEEDPAHFKSMRLIWSRPVGVLEREAQEGDPRKLGHLRLPGSAFIPDSAPGIKVTCYFRGDALQSIVDSTRAIFTRHLLRLLGSPTK